MNKVKDFYYNFKNFFINIYKYRKFLYINSWCDHYFIYYLLREKLVNDLKMYKKHSCIAEYQLKNIVDSMSLCIMILNRLIDDNYLFNALYFYDKKYPDWMFGDGIEVPDPEWYRRCSAREEKQRKQDIDYLFKIMSKNIEGWWE